MASRKVSSVFRPALFTGKAAIVTGGGTGIGMAIAQELLYLGCNVMVASRKLDRLSAAAEEMKKQIPQGGPARLEYMQCNIRSEESVASLVDTTLEKFGKIDYLVNNAGGQFPMSVGNIPLKGWNAVVETNLTGTFLMCREVYQKWMEANGGSIVNIIADMWKGFPGMSHTGAARAGVDNLTKSMAVEWAPHGIRVNAVAPGSSIYSETAASNYDANANVFNLQIDRIPAKRLGKTEEVSAGVCFLLSPAAAFISGETMIIDGAHRLVHTSGFWEVEDHQKLPAYTWEKDLDEKKKQESSETNDPKSKL